VRVQFNPRPRVGIVLRRDVTISENREHQTIYRPCRNQLSLSLSLACSLSHLKESSCVVALTRNSTLHFATLRRSLRVSLVYIILTPCTAASARLRPPQPQLIVHLLYIYGRTVQTTFYLSFCVPRYTSKICRDTSCTGPAGHSPCNRGETVPRKV